MTRFRLPAFPGTAFRTRSPRDRRLALPLALALLLGACGPRAHIPPRATLAPARIPGAVPASDPLAQRARRLAPVLYLQRDEWFPLSRVVAVIHPERRLIAYHLLWRDDVHGAWIPFTVPTDQELVWVGYDSTEAPTDVWTYWHGTTLHTPWPGRQVVIDVQWGKHGSLPRHTNEADLPASKKLNGFWLSTYVGLPDIWLGRLTRRGPLCFCHGYRRYREFTTPLPLASRIDAFVVTDRPGPALKAVFGSKYSGKGPWPPDTTAVP